MGGTKERVGGTKERVGGTKERVEAQKGRVEERRSGRKKWAGWGERIGAGGRHHPCSSTGWEWKTRWTSHVMNTLTWIPTWPHCGSQPMNHSATFRRPSSFPRLSISFGFLFCCRALLPPFRHRHSILLRRLCPLPFFVVEKSSSSV